jgi:hypothetical protein
MSMARKNSLAFVHQLSNRHVFFLLIKYIAGSALSKNGSAWGKKGGACSLSLLLVLQHVNQTTSGGKSY